MNQPFPKGLASEQGGSCVVLECSREDLTGAGGSTIHEGEHRSVVDRLEARLDGVIDSLAVAGFDDGPTGKEVVGDG